VSLEHLTNKCGRCDKRVSAESPLCHDCTSEERNRSRAQFVDRKKEFGSLDAYFDHLLVQARKNDAMRKKL